MCCLINKTIGAFEINNSKGRDLAKGLNTFGIGDNMWRGENLFAGRATAQEALEAWKDSPGHNANMVRQEFTKIGIARAFREGTTYGWYWVTEFAGDEPEPQNTVPAPTPTPIPAPPALPHAPIPTAPSFCVLLGNTEEEGPLLFQNPSTEKPCSVF